MKRMLEAEQKSHGTDQELERLTSALFAKVIPRLLRPMETEGRGIQPCLIHSDLWPGNIKHDAETDKIMIFDSCAFWGHNEGWLSNLTALWLNKERSKHCAADLGPWRAPRYRLGKSYVKEYHKHILISPPEEDWDDRNLLYAVYENICTIVSLHVKQVL